MTGHADTGSGSLRRNKLALLLAVYLGIGPVYWIPGVPPEWMSVLKGVLFVLIVLCSLALAVSRKRIAFPGGTRVLALLLMFVGLMVPGMIKGDGTASLYRVQNGLQVLLFVAATGHILRHVSPSQVAIVAVRIFTVFSMAALAAMLVAPDIVNPYNPDLTIVESGFGGSRTGWSPANALFLPWLALDMAMPGGTIVAYAAMLVLFGNQVAVGGRAGLLGTAVAYVASQVLRARFVSLLWAVMALAGLVAAAMTFSDELRLFDFFTAGGITLDVADEASTGRAGQYVWAISVIQDEPLSGLGFGNAIFGEKEWLIHNDFLMLSVEGGIPLGLVALAIVMYALVQGWRAARHGSRMTRAACLTVVVGAVVAQFEPGFIFGNFNTSCLWWFSFCVCVSAPVRSRARREGLAHA